MATTIASPEVKPGGPGGRGPFGGGDRRRRWGGYPGKLPPGTHRLGMLLGLSAIAMLFIAVTSSYIVRQGLGSGWEPVPMPSVMPFGTAVLLASSATLELARRALGGSPAAMCAWMRVTLALGVLFVAGQIAAWRQLATEGFYLSSSAHSSFFYTLTAMHGLHVLGGLAAVGYLTRRALEGQRLARWMDVTALYWHFMDGLWLYLLVLLFAWR